MKIDIKLPDDDPMRIEASAAAMAAIFIQHFTVPPRIQGLILRRCAEICESGAAVNDQRATGMRLLATPGLDIPPDGPETDPRF